MKEFSSASGSSFPPNASSNEIPAVVPLLFVAVLEAKLCVPAGLGEAPAELPPNASSKDKEGVFG